MKDARNEAMVEANLHADVDKALGATKQKNQDLAIKLAVEERGRRSDEARLKKAEDLVEEQ